MGVGVVAYRYPGHYDDYLSHWGVFDFLQQAQKSGIEGVHHTVVLGLQTPAVVAVAGEELGLLVKLNN